MAEANIPVKDIDAEIAYERGVLEEIELCFQAIDRLQRAWLKSLSNGDLSLEKAHGRRCVLSVTGLKHIKYAKVFVVMPDGVRIVPLSEGVPAGTVFNTIIETPVESVVNVLKGVLSGDEDAFSKEWTRGTSRVIGERRIHDGYVFSEVFRRLASKIKKYKEVRQ